MRIGSGIRAGLAAGALAATAALAGCGGGSTDAATASAAGSVNGPYGAGGPYSAPGAHAGGQRAAASGAGSGGRAALEATGPVDGSTQLNESHGIWWLPELGPGVNATAPETVRPGTASAADAEAGFYDAFYAGRMTAACGYVVPGERRGCAARLARAAPGAGSLRDAEIGYVVAEGDAALVSMTGVVCGSHAAPDSCLGQRSGGWFFEQRETFVVLWARLAAAGGNPLTATPLRLMAGRWYVDLTPPASPGS
jgi:hypothetical protein